MVIRGILGVALLLLAGCGQQIAIIESRHWDLNEMIRETKNEQFLLNIVRLRYDETPFFLQFGSITTNFATSASAGVSGSIPEQGSSILGLDAGVAYSESPTVTWALPDSQKLLGRLLAPLGADQLAALTQSGHSPSFVFRVGVQKINRLRNLGVDPARGITVPESYSDFREMLDLLDELLLDGVVDLSFAVYSTVGGGKIPISLMDPRAMMAEALPSGMQFMTRDDPDVFEPLKLSKPLFLRFTRGSDADPRAQRLRALLDLDPQRYSFAIIDTAASGTEQLLSESGQLSRVLDPKAPMREIVVNNRSVMQILRIASSYVTVPESALSKGTVMARAEPPSRLMQIDVSRTNPADAWLSVERDGLWYFIRRDDLATRRTFTMLDSLFSSVVGDVPGSKPLLTLPVK